MARQLKNFAETTLALSMTDSDNAGIFTDGSVFPTSGDFIVRIEDEYIKITARSGNNFTCDRAQEGSTAVVHLVDSLVKLVLSKETLEEYFGDNYILGAASSRPGTGKIGQIFQATDIDAAWRYQTNGWELVHPCFVPYNGAIDISTWTSFNLGSTNWVVSTGLLAVDSPTGTVDNLRGYYKNIPSAPYTATVAMRFPTHWGGRDSFGLTLSDTTKHYTFCITTNDASMLLQTQTWTTVTSAASSPLSTGLPADDVFFFRIRDNNTNWFFEYSQDNKNWAIHQQVARNTHLTATKIGFFRNRVENIYPNGVFSTLLGYWE